MPSDERTPLLQNHDSGNWWDLGASQDVHVDFHAQFCRLVGIPPIDVPDTERQPIGPKTLYGRVLHQKTVQKRTYAFTAGISNSLLLAQVVIGAAVTGLGASESSHILITLFGAANTIIAGVVAYLKSRGQPMRAHMFKDDLERVVDEIENSEIMFLGITKRMHGYQDIDIDKSVTVRSEVARLTRLYERAVRSATMNSPDIYMAGAGGDANGIGLRAHPTPAQALAAPPAPVSAAGAEPSKSAPSAPTAAPLDDLESSPATAPPNPPAKEEQSKGGSPKEGSKQEDQSKEDQPKDHSEDTSAESSKVSSKEGANPTLDGASKGKPADTKPSATPASKSDPDEAPATKP